ncbi:MAG: zinc-dependent metalloprotease family protein [Myxococcaceae bacterium]
MPRSPFALMLLPLLLAACAPAEATIDDESGGSEEDVLDLGPQQSDSIESALVTGPQVVFVNFGGPTVCDNATDYAPHNKSNIMCPFFGVCGKCKDFAAYAGSDKAAIVSTLKGYYSAYDVQVVTSRPSSGPYTMVVVSPTFGPHHGVAALDCGNHNRNGVAFVLRTADSFYTSIAGGNRAKGIAKAAAHELGHSFGLGHRGTVNSASTDHMDVWSRGSAWNTGPTSDSGNCVGGTGKTQNSDALLAAGLGRHP